MRSGTTALQSVLCSTDETNPILQEAQYFTRLAASYADADRNFDRFLSDYFEDRRALKTYHASLLKDLVSRTLARYRPASTLVLKNPEMTALFPAIADLLDEVCFVVTVRDPRDTIASMIDVARRQAAQGQETPLTRMGGDPSRFAAQFNWYYAAVLRNPSEALRRRTLFVRYEDLVSDAHGVAMRLSEFTGLPLQDFDPTLPWRARIDFRAQVVAGDPFHAALRGEALSRERIGRHTKTLSQQDVRAIEQACGDFMDRFGYARSADG